MNGQAPVPSSCGWAEGTELKMHFRLRHTMTHKGSLHSSTAHQCWLMCQSQLPFEFQIKSPLLLLFLFFPYLCPKLLGGSTCLCNCAYIETVLLFSLYRKQQLSNLNQINYKNVPGNCSCSQIQSHLVPIKADIDTSFHNPECLSAFSSVLESLRPLKLVVLSHLC